MVKILISEDNEKKLSEIRSHILSLGVPNGDIMVAKNMAEFTSKFNPEIGICVIDIRIPAYDGGEADQNGLGILQHLNASSNSNIKMLAISSYPEEFEEIRPQFERFGCILADFSNKDVWKNALSTCVLQSASQEKFDFLIFTALREERAPYTALSYLKGEQVLRDEITRYDISVNGKSGTIIELPRMGLVDASIFASKYIDRYSPSLVAMSGICAGFSTRAELGQLLISELAYEYQTGKWTDDGFTAEPYQSSISPKIRAIIEHKITDDNFIYDLEDGWRGSRPTTTHTPKLAIFTSGSAVIAGEKHMESISNYHRKVSGLDMEIFGIHRAAELAYKKPDILCAKVVVDLADKDKNDEIHSYGSFISSKFVLEVIKDYFD